MFNQSYINGNDKEREWTKCETIKDALMHIFLSYGFEIINDKAKFLSLISDFAPSLKKEKKLVKVMLNADTFLELKIASDNDIDKKVAIRKIVYKLNDEFLIDKDLAEQAVDWFAECFCWKVNTQLEKVIVSEEKKSIQTAAEKRQPKVGENSVDEKYKRYIGKICEFGKYSVYSKDTGKSIEWKVLVVTHEKALLWAMNCLDVYVYNNIRTNFENRLKWSDSDLCEWLNYDFYKRAFDNKRYICELDKFGLNHVFILSKNEILKYNNNNIQNMSGKATRQVMISTYAGGYNATGVTYWTRTVDSDKNGYIICVDQNGRFESEVCFKSGIGVRPAIWVDVKLLDNIKFI